mgnify:CR=1 FL=1
MKKVEIVRDGCLYLQRFEANETYVKSARAIQSNLHNDSEHTSIWSSGPKAFDLITARGYLQTLCEEMRWGKYDEKEITLRFFDTDRMGDNG